MNFQEVYLIDESAVLREFSAGILSRIGILRKDSLHHEVRHRTIDVKLFNTLDNDVHEYQKKSEA